MIILNNSQSLYNLSKRYLPNISILPFTQLSLRRQYAKKVETGPPPGVKSASQKSLDPRYEIIKGILFNSQKTNLPTLTNQDLEQHETIERAWKLYTRYRRERRYNEMAKKFESMCEANLELEITDPNLFKQAQLINRKEALFPKKMKVPTETPPLTGWNYDYVHPKDPDNEIKITDLENSVDQDELQE
ncbi:hypothetical protein G9A89_022456 [Geosiphon pyriformis]|nr:hypothetical protein G9A89_022456 [Geosiphon pyriformis]